MHAAQTALASMLVQTGGLNVPTDPALSERASPVSLLGAKRCVGVHRGTFELADESLDQPPKDLAAARIAQGLPDADFSVMAIGETRLSQPRLWHLQHMTMAAVAHSVWWRANIPVAAGATLLTNPFTVSFWLWLAYQAGSLLIDAPPPAHLVQTPQPLIPVTDF